MDSENGDLHGDGAAEEGIPTYDEAFPSLPELSETQRLMAEVQKSTWAATAIKPSLTTQVFTIAHEELKEPETDSLGKKRSIFKIIADETSTSISRSMSKDKSVTITISGKQQSVMEARKRLLASLQTEIVQEVAVPKELHRFIIGKEGKVLQGIEASTGTSIKVPHSSDAKQTISVKGAVENVRRATAEITAISDEKAKSDSIRLPIPKAYHSLIAGCNNVNVKRIVEKTGARINIPPSSVEKDEIVVSGEKPGVGIAAQDISAIFEQLRLTCGQMTVQIKKSQHRYIIGSRGAAINDIHEKTGVVVEVPSQDNESDQVILRGPQDRLGEAVAMVFERANSLVNETISIPEWLHRHVIGRGGAHLKRFQEHAAKVRVDFNKEGDEITLDGPPEEVAVLKAGLLTLAGELAKVLTHMDKKVDAKFHPHLVGRGGSVITQIRADTGAEISFLNPKEKPNLVRIVGSEADVKKAAAAIDEIVRKQENMRSIDIIVPRKFHASLIGTQGATIRSITDLFPTCSINMPRAADSEIVVVRGDKKDVDGAEKMIRKLLKQFEEEGFQLEVPVFKEFHRQIIGRQGAKIKEIMQETSTRVRFPDEDSDSNVIVIVGTQKNCEKAREMLTKIQGELASVVQEEMQIDARYHAAIIGPKGRVVSSIMQECGGVNIHFPHGGDKAAKPNVVTIRGPKDDVAKAKARLEELSTAETLSHHTEEAKVKREFIRFLVGRGGSERTRIQDATHARLFFPRTGDGLAPAEGDDIITIVGTKEACAAAKTRILDRVKQLENTTEATVTVETQYYKDMTANRGRFLRDLAEEFGGVNVVLPRSTDGKYASDVLQVKGSKEDVPKAIARIQQFVEDIKNRVTVDVKIPGSAVAAVMGAGGSNVNRICGDFNVSIKLPERKRGDSERAPSEGAAERSVSTGSTGDAAAPAEEEKQEVVHVSGTQANCEAAIAALLALVPIRETVEVDPKFFPGIIGEKGSKIEKLQADCNVRFNLPKKGNVVTIRGTPPNVEIAKERLAAVVADLESKCFTATVDVDARHHSTLIGIRGAAVREFRTKHEVEITFPKDGAENPNGIVLTGYEKNVNEARDELLAKAHELDSMVTLELSIDPRVHSQIIGARGAAVKALQDKHKVRIIFPKEKGSSKILVVGSEEGAEEAKSAIEISADDFMQDILEEEHLQQYVKPTKYVRDRDSAPEAKPSNESFAVRDAPWPTLGAGAPVAKAAPAWGSFSKK